MHIPRPCKAFLRGITGLSTSAFSNATEVNLALKNLSAMLNLTKKKGRGKPKLNLAVMELVALDGKQHK